MTRTATVKGAASAAPINPNALDAKPALDAKVVRFLVRIDPDAVRVTLTDKGRALLARLDEADARRCHTQP